ncbi:hypothetical protein PQX77_019778 [Marasmius sp. AFHP31]|nr:hypothetical protein PQX77_019778 [Marasmius sp. AFHP31]
MHSLTPFDVIGSFTTTAVYTSIARRHLSRLAQLTRNKSLEVSSERALSHAEDIQDIVAQPEQKGDGGTGDMKKSVDKRVEVDRFEIAGEVRCARQGIFFIGRLPVNSTSNPPRYPLLGLHPYCEPDTNSHPHGTTGEQTCVIIPQQLLPQNLSVLLVLLVSNTQRLWARTTSTALPPQGDVHAADMGVVDERGRAHVLGLKSDQEQFSLLSSIQDVFSTWGASR